MRESALIEERAQFSGSITVFLTILFLLFFALIGVSFENVRILSAGGYMRVAAHSAAMTVFGGYNRELYQDYGLFAYGGCEGSGIADLADEFTGILSENLQSAPAGGDAAYGNLYQFQEVQGTVCDAGLLTDRKIFLEQIEAYLKSAAVQDLTEKIKSKVSGKQADSGIREKLALTKEYEEGKYDVPEGQGEGEEKLPAEKAASENMAKGNPLEVFTDLMRDGVLSLVCDAKRLSDGAIPPSDGSDAPAGALSTGRTQVNMGAADYLRGLVDGELSDEYANEEDKMQSSTVEGENDRSIIEKGADKAKYICYANKQFGSYTEEKNRTTKYGLEYLIAGNREERDNLAHVVNKLLCIRLLLNFGCIVTNAVLQEKSFATAAVLAGFTGMPPVIRAVQYTILLILAFEEACVDVTALLEGRSVPVLKKAGDLKVKYEEICLASKKLFAAKAKGYASGGKVTAADITYNQYLWFFLLEQPVEKMENRSFDLIQYDLREKYNQTFVIRTCICQSSYEVQYEIPFIFAGLPVFNSNEAEKVNHKKLEVNYGYKSR